VRSHCAQMSTAKELGELLIERIGSRRLSNNNAYTWVAHSPSSSNVRCCACHVAWRAAVRRTRVRLRVFDHL
jgi:hypothetical protein